MPLTQNQLKVDERPNYKYYNESLLEENTGEKCDLSYFVYISRCGIA